MANGGTKTKVPTSSKRSTVQKTITRLGVARPAYTVTKLPDKRAFGSPIPTLEAFGSLQELKKKHKGDPMDTTGGAKKKAPQKKVARKY